MELRNFTGIALAIAELNQIMFTNHIDMSIFVVAIAAKNSWLHKQAFTTLSLCRCDRIL
ncbi:hypothetical protein [Nostoc sp. UIC 10630]|uniref:hypothetical protein n=1 Tax=Nostoc sp. UIC 10630 TaxID=2100146 RepID=UPI0013D3B654|nr:hypothetical protein [Nostoc sp. UIC 10630]NEU84287.1 hypothetical protein [Nostoc sp. UIC 10630]